MARAISLAEDDAPLAGEVVADLYPHTGRAVTVGITGAPGVGKSSVISALVAHLRAEDRSSAWCRSIPSSPFTHGALLGDRIRLTDHFLDPGVYIRSMGTRGRVGGLAEATLQAGLIVEASGRDVVLYETVGVGQSEVAVASLADTVALVLMPGSGDSHPGAEGRDHGDPRPHRGQQGRPPAGRPAAGRAASGAGPRRSRPPAAGRGDAGHRRLRDPRAVGAHHGASRGAGGGRARSRSVGGAASSTRCSRSPPRAPRGTWRRRSSSAHELRALLDEVGDRRLDPLTAVRRILEQVYELERRALGLRRRGRPGRHPRARASSASRASRSGRRSSTPGRSRPSPAPACFLKAENLQKTGSFKIRGALNRLSRLTEGSAGRQWSSPERRQPRARAWPSRRASSASRSRSTCRWTPRWPSSRPRRATAPR